MELYLKLNADKVKPYKITLIKRDVKDPSGADAKIAVQELLTQDNVDILAGWIYSPNAIASAPIVTAGKKLAVIMNAGTAHITNLSPYYVRTSFSMWHAGYALGEAAAKILNAKTAVVGYTDFPPGKDSLAAFKRALRGERRQGDRRDPDGRRRRRCPTSRRSSSAPKDKKPDVFFVFVPGRRPRRRRGQDLRRARHARGRHQADRPGRHHAGHQAAGHGRRRRSASSPCTTTTPISTIRRTSASSRRGRRSTAPTRTPDFMAVGGYDGMAAIVHVVQHAQGQDRTATRRWRRSRAGSSTSPRGPIMIDPVTRDIVMNEYLSEVGDEGRPAVPEGASARSTA